MAERYYQQLLLIGYSPVEAQEEVTRLIECGDIEEDHYGLQDDFEQREVS